MAKTPPKAGPSAAKPAKRARVKDDLPSTVDPETGKPRRGRPPGATVTELPDGWTDGEGLTLRQRRILESIRESVETRGYPPSMREIGSLVGLTSPSSVAHQLHVLERKGYIRRDPNLPRAIEVYSPDSGEAARPASRTAKTSPNRPAAGVDETGYDDQRPKPTYVPVLGRIAAGAPILADEAVEDVFALPRQIVGDTDASGPRSTCSRSRATRWWTPRSVTATGSWCARPPRRPTARSWPR